MKSPHPRHKGSVINANQTYFSIFENVNSTESKLPRNVRALKMNKSKLVASFGQDKTVNTTTRASNVDTSIRVQVKRRVSARHYDGVSMSSMDAAPPHLLMQNVRDIRKRLMETEKTLNKITKAEANLENDELDDLISITSTDSRRRVPYADMEDDRESVQSGLATLPDSSYAGFERVQPPSSTPNKPPARSRLTGLLEMVEPREDPDFSQERRHFDSEDDRQDLRAQIKFLKEANKKVLIQNQKLMNEVEKTSFDLQASRAKVRELSSELDEFRQSVPDLEDRVVGLQAETESQDKALREAEERFEVSQREVVQAARKMKDMQQELDEFRNELYEERKIRRGLESQRDEALQNFIEAQDTLEVYRGKSKDRLKKYENNEDHLRDSLSNANREREELLERLSWYQSKVKGQQEEIRKLQSIQEVEEDHQSSLEEQNKELRSQISKQSSKITRLEADSQLIESLQFENSQVRLQFESQGEQLVQCQQEIEESRTMLLQLEQLASQVQQHSLSRPSSRNNSLSNDSGNFSIRYTGESSSSLSFHKPTGGAEASLATLQGNSTSAKNILSDLRLKLAMKDAEIQRLQASLKQRESADQSGMVENLRTDVESMIEKNQRSAEQVQELEGIIAKLENEKERHLNQIKELRREMSDRDSESSSFEMRISQRNGQLVELQEQLNDKAMELAKLERQHRQQSSKITSLEEQVDEKSAQCSHQASRLSQLEQEIGAHEAEAQTLHKELREKDTSTDSIKREKERIQKIHQEQCKDYQKQIDIIQERVDNKASQANEWEKQTDILRREISEKNHRLQETEHLLAQTQEDLSEKKTQSKEIVKQLEAQARESTNQVRQLEAALKLCKDEIRTYIGALEETKDIHDREIAKRDEKIKRIDRQLKVQGHELEVKSVECERYEKQLLETNTLLQQSAARIQELDDQEMNLQTQVSGLEQKLLTGNSQWLSDQQSMESKLKQACEDLERRTAQLQQLTATLKSVQGQKNEMATELELMESQLRDEQEDNDVKTERVTRLEKDIRDMRVQLEQKIELVTDFEDQLQQKNVDMEQQLHLVSDLDIEIKRLQDVHQDALERIASLEKQLDKAGYEAKAKDEMMDDMKDSLNSVQEELSVKKSEVTELQIMLDERQTELEERVSLVGQLDQTIKEQHKEMEQRIQKLNTNLQKNEVEVHERTKQIADLDDKLGQTQAQLREKTLQFQQTEQIAQKQQLELHSKTAKLEELETLVTRQKNKLEEQKDENVEITQELRLTREQLQKQHSDFMATRRELGGANREQEKLQRELEELRIMLEGKNADFSRLAEELGASKAREKEVECRLSAAMQKLSEDHEDLDAKYQSELCSLREEIADYREANDILKAQLKDKNKHLSEMEEHYAQQVQVAAHELDGINEEMELRKQQTEVSSEQLILKDSEIARLQAKMSGLERTLSAMRSADTFSLSEYTAGVKDIASEGQVQIVHEIESQSQGHQLRSNGQDYSRQNLNTASKEIILTDVSVTVPHPQSQSYEFGQEVEIVYVSKGDENDNNSQSMKENRDQENIEPSGPVRMLNFSDCDEKNSYNSVIHRPKPVLPNSAYTKNKHAVLSGSSKESDTASKQSQSAFSRIPKERRTSKGEHLFPGEKELEPLTAMRLYNPDTFDPSTSDLDPEQCMKELQDRLRANELRQQDIDRQLQSLEDEETNDSDR